MIRGKFLALAPIRKSTVCAASFFIIRATCAQFNTASRLRYEHNLSSHVYRANNNKQQSNAFGAKIRSKIAFAAKYNQTNSNVPEAIDFYIIRVCLFQLKQMLLTYF